MDTETLKRKILPILKEAGVKRSAVFGSFARGETTDASDVDILVELPPNKSLLDLADLRLKLEDALQAKVDVVTYRSLHPLLKTRILEEQVSLL